jgi:hypothetical protein
VKPIAVFKSGRGRAEHLLKLAELLTNTRERKMRQDWARDFKEFMHWKQREQIDRVDGTGAMLILRASANITSKNFNEDYTSELLRAAHVTIVAALDRYCHELIVSRVVAALEDSNHTQELRKLAIPVIEVHKAVKHGRKKGARPMNIVRQAIQDQLHRDTFQKPDDVVRGLKIIGVENLWPTCATEMGCTANDIVTRLRDIVDRRNKIVHEGDIVRHKRGGKIRYRKITPRQVAKDIVWIGDLVDAIEAAV